MCVGFRYGQASFILVTCPKTGFYGKTTDGLTASNRRSIYNLTRIDVLVVSNVQKKEVLFSILNTHSLSGPNVLIV